MDAVILRIRAIAISGSPRAGRLLRQTRKRSFLTMSMYKFTARLEPRSLRVDWDSSNGMISCMREIGVKRLAWTIERYFYSTAYPWRCVGRWKAPIGSGSGCSQARAI